jgi:two-component system, cell cycle response regulator
MNEKSLAYKNQGKNFVVALIGAKKSDQDTLSRVFNVTGFRRRSYTLFSVNEASNKEACEQASKADIHLVDVTNPQAIMMWHKVAAKIEKKDKAPVIKITRALVKDSNEISIQTPINPAKVLQSLDDFTVQHLQYFPEFEIGSEKEASQSTIDTIKSMQRAIDANLSDEEKRHKHMRVLVADDSLTVRRQLKMEFELMGAHLILAEDGDAALREIQQQQFDLIFMDVVMPGTDGYSACKSIRKSTLNAHTPLVLLTSKSSKFDKLKGVLAGCDTYLTKPINHSEFNDVVKKYTPDAFGDKK